LQTAQETTNLSQQLKVKEVLEYAAQFMDLCSRKGLPEKAAGVMLRAALHSLLCLLPKHTTLQPISEPLQLSTSASQTSAASAAHNEDWAQGFTQLLVEDAATVGVFQGHCWYANRVALCLTQPNQLM
jgi:hypothetical protein